MGIKMGLKNYMSQKPVALATLPGTRDEAIVVSSIYSFKNNLEMVENIILKHPANQNKAP